MTALALLLAFIGPPDASITDAMERLSKAEQLANEDPAAGADELATAVRALHQYPRELAEDSALQEARMYALLSLARARLASDDPIGAQEAVDEAIRTARGDALPSAEFGPTLDKLKKQRIEAVAAKGTATLELTCHAPCDVFINEKTSEPTTKLPLGEYRLHVESAQPGGPAPWTIDVLVDTPDKTTALSWGESAKPEPEPEPQPDPAGAAAARRVAPRWVEISALVAGVGLMAAGTVLLAINGRCPDGADPSDPDACPQVYTTLAPGAAMLAGGGALGLAGGIMLGISEVRVANARAAQAMVTWTVRF